MRAVLEHIAARQAAFAGHPFFAELKLDRPVDQAMAFAPRLAFWVLTFQDILRLNESLVRDSQLKRIARHHRAEDANHDHWFLEDIAHLTGQGLSVSALYGRTHLTTRDSAYALMSEVFRVEDDYLRIVLLMTLESTGHIFFSRIAPFTATKYGTENLRYFSDYHLRIEKNHEMFEEAQEAELRNIVLSPQVRAEALALVDRAYAAFDKMFHGLRMELASEAAESRKVPATGTSAVEAQLAQAVELR